MKNSAIVVCLAVSLLSTSQAWSQSAEKTGASAADALLEELVAPEETSPAEETGSLTDTVRGSGETSAAVAAESEAGPAEEHVRPEAEGLEDVGVESAAAATAGKEADEVPEGVGQAEAEEGAGYEEAAKPEEELIEIGLEKPAPPGMEVQPSEEEKNLISLSLDNVPLQDVIRMFTRISGANIVAGTNLQGTVTVSLQDVEWLPALRVILDSVDMTMVEKSPGIFVIMSKEEMATEPVTVETIQLRYTTVSNVLPIVQQMLISSNASVAGFPSANSIVVQETASQISKIRETVSKLDVPRPQVFIEAKFVELNDQAIKDLGINWQVLSGYTIGLHSPSFAWARHRLKQEGTDEYSNRTTRDYQTRTYTDSDTRNYIVQDAYVDADYSASAFLLVNGVPSLAYQSSEGSIGARGRNFTAFDLAEGTIQTVPEREHIISDVSQTLNETLVEGGRRVTKSVLTTTEELLSAILTADDFAITLSALKQNNGVDIISNPRIIVASGETATIHVGVQEPNIQAKPQGDTGTAYVYGLDEGQRFFDVGVKVSVTPTVNTEDRITVRIEPELSRLLAPARVEQVGIEFPRIQTRKITTEFNIPSGRTVAIGGLTQTSDREQMNKIPLLGDIPIIGKYLFSHRHTEREQDEVIIFVTVGMAAAEDLTQVSGIPSGGKLIHERLARERSGNE